MRSRNCFGVFPSRCTNLARICFKTVSLGRWLYVQFRCSLDTHAVPLDSDLELTTRTSFGILLFLRMAGSAINLAIVALIVGTCCAQQDWTVNTDRGPIKGISRRTVFRNQSFISFTGIPYAKPPVGQLRFKAPEDVEAWTEVRDATSDGSVCPQLAPSGGVVGDEDCLTLNVYTPLTDLENRSEKIATLIFIHGGSFRDGSKDRTFYGPDFLLEQNLIVVTLNYRLGVLGFGALNTSDMAGNQGLKDQNLALRWISRNIEKFGGDPYNITLSGESSGSASVHLHMLSDMSRGLFQRSIGQSGNPLRTQTPEEAQADCIQLMTTLGFPMNDTKEIYDKLMSTSPADIVTATAKMTKPGSPSFQPIVENLGVSPQSTTFLSDCPIKKFVTGDYTHMPHILGRNDQEALSYSEPLDQLVRIIINSFQGAGYNLPPSTIPSAIVDIFNNRIPYVSDQIALAVINFASKLFFNAPIELIQRYMTTNNQHPIYYYDFTYVPENAAHTKLFNVLRKGAGHADELSMIYYIPQVNPSTDLNDPDNQMAQIITCYWGNFAKTGNPTPPGATDACSAAKWEDSRLQGQMMNITNTPHMINRQTDAETELLVLYTQISNYLTSGCK